MVLEVAVMSLSKVYKNTSKFVPEQILPRQDHPSEQAWQDMGAGPSSRHEQQGSFVPDKTNGQEIITDALSFTPQHHTNSENNLSHDHLIEAEKNRDKTPAPAIDLEMIRRNAFAEGVLTGRRQADEDFGTSAGALQAACNQLAHLHETILLNNTKEMHSLVIGIAEKIIRHSIHEQSDTILATIEEAIRRAVKSEEFEIRVNPEDLEIIKQKKQEIIDEISGLNNIVLKADKSVERGGCLLESVNCTVDATISSQLQVINEALQSNQNTDTSFPEEP